MLKKKIHEQLLANGARVILAPRQETEAVTLLVMFGVGSRQESVDNNGVSHFIEHLFFKGTTHRPSTLLISQELDKIGASYNAFTSKDYTGYYVKVAKKHLPIAFDILSDMLLHPLFKGVEINRERGVIIEEIRMYQDNPAWHIGDILEQSVYRGHPLGQDIAGPEEVIAGIKRSDIIGYRDSFYAPANMVIALAGNFSKTTAHHYLHQYFDKPFGPKQVVSGDHLLVPAQTQPRLQLEYKDTAQAQLALGWVAPGKISSNYWPLLVMATILGGNMSSRLFINVRERNGLAYTVKAGVDDHPDVSTFYVQAGVAKDKLDKTLSLIWRELRQIKNKLVTKTELDKAKDYLQGKLVLSLEDSFTEAYRLAEQTLWQGKVQNIARTKRAIAAVTPAQVRQIARHILNSVNTNLAIIGPYKSKTKFKQWLNKQII